MRASSGQKVVEEGSFHVPRFGAFAGVYVVGEFFCVNLMKLQAAREALLSHAGILGFGCCHYHWFLTLCGKL